MMITLILAREVLTIPEQILQMEKFVVRLLLVQVQSITLRVEVAVLITTPRLV
jgi:hypothetical protein